MMAQFYAANKDKSSPKLTAEKFNPFAKPSKPKARPATPADMAELFGPRE